jgi:hypothetical protein
MLRYRHTQSHPVYWPAFADILTVVIVILMCTLAIHRDGDSLPGGQKSAPGNHTTEIHTKLVDAPAASVTEFRSDILHRKSACVTKYLQARLGTLSVRSGPEIRICTFSANDAQTCRQSLNDVTSALSKTTLDQLEMNAGVDVATVFVRVRTGLNSPATTVAKSLLNDAHEALRLHFDQSWSSHLGNQHYEEEGDLSRNSDLALAIVTRLRKQDVDFIRDRWDKQDWAALEKQRELASECGDK